MNSIKYQVFLSSTYSDLKEERESIIKAVLEMYHIPIGMEMFSAEDEDQWEIIRRTIDVSDYYVLVLGLRYGSKTSDGISFTQKEYEYALENNIPILAFVMDEMASLSKDKRDDDLSEINNFREIVLKNSKMSQFWETKDQLIKNVSISLMKQIMQKPGVGWVRGDKARSEEALTNELTILSKENRELRERIMELESKISYKIPKIKIDIISPNIDDQFNSFQTLTLPEKLDINDVEDHLKKYVSKDDIRKYNNSIPNQTEIYEYNDALERWYKIKNYSVPLVVDVSNLGTIKANNLYIDIEFPDGIFIYENRTGFDEPKKPLPYNPIRAAQVAYEKELEELRNKTPLGRLFNSINHMDSIGSLSGHALDFQKIRPLTQSWWTKLDGRKLTIKINSLLHTRHMIFDDEYMIAPLNAGKHNIEVRVICEELESQQINVFEMDV